jgi:hypothetical protein
VMALRPQVFADLGGFDEGYWNGNEDVDLCLRAGEAGWRVFYEPASVLTHQESASGTERFRATAANRERLTRRWAKRVVDERVAGGVVVAGPFGSGGQADELARSLAALAEGAGVPLVTRPWPERHDGWAHRLGPGQRLALSALGPKATAQWAAAEAGWLPEEAKVLAGPDELAAAGLLGDGAAQALMGLVGDDRRSA